MENALAAAVKNMTSFLPTILFGEKTAMEMKMTVEEAKKRAVELMYRGYH
jgi:hypothetical protein